MGDDAPRIVIVSNTLDPGGAEVQKVTLANHLAGAGERVHLVLLQREGALRSRVRPAVGMKHETYRRPLRTPADVLVTGTTNTELFKGVISRLRHPRLRWIVAIHDPVGPEAKTPSRFRAVCLLIADRVIGLSATHAEGLARYWRFRPDSLVSNGVDVKWAAEVVSRRAALERYDFDLLYFGRLDTHHKGIDLLLDAISAGDPGWTLCVAGVGPDEPALRERVRTAGLADRVAFIGYIEPASAMTLAKALVLLSRYEGQPMVLIEAAAAGVPAVVSQYAGVESGPGVRVVDARNVLAVVDAVRAVLEDADPLPVRQDDAPMAAAYMRQFAALGHAPAPPTLHLSRRTRAPGGAADEQRESRHRGRRVGRGRCR